MALGQEEESRDGGSQNSDLGNAPARLRGEMACGEIGVLRAIDVAAHRHARAAKRPCGRRIRTTIIIV